MPLLALAQIDLAVAQSGQAQNGEAGVIRQHGPSVGETLRKQVLHTRPAPPLGQLRRPDHIDRSPLLVLRLPLVVGRRFPLRLHLGERALFPRLAARDADASRRARSRAPRRGASRAEPFVSSPRRATERLRLAKFLEQRGHGVERLARPTASGPEGLELGDDAVLLLAGRGCGTRRERTSARFLCRCPMPCAAASARLRPPGEFNACMRYRRSKAGFTRTRMQSALTIGSPRCSGPPGASTDQVPRERQRRGLQAAPHASAGSRTGRSYERLIVLDEPAHRTICQLMPQLAAVSVVGGLEVAAEGTIRNGIGLRSGEVFQWQP